MFPAQDFFVPSHEFITWVRETPWLRYRRLVDCGAGTGRFAQEINVGQSFKLDVKSIDIIERDSYHSFVDIADSTRFGFDGDDVVFICRPCHSDFAEKTFLRAFDYGVVDMFYIGLERNLEIDFSENIAYRLEMSNIGKSGENLYRVLGPQYAMKLFAKIDYGNGQLGWGSYFPATKKLVNAGGGYRYVELNEILETAYAAYSTQLDYEPESPNEADSIRAQGTQAGRYGWIAPDGRFYPCGYCGHDALIYDYFRINSTVETKQNWVKCVGKFYHCSNFDLKPNREQLKTLKLVGYDTKHDDAESAKLYS